MSPTGFETLSCWPLKRQKIGVEPTPPLKLKKNKLRSPPLRPREPTAGNLSAYALDSCTLLSSFPMFKTHTGTSALWPWLLSIKFETMNYSWSNSVRIHILYRCIISYFERFSEINDLFAYLRAVYTSISTFHFKHVVQNKLGYIVSIEWSCDAIVVHSAMEI